ALSNLALADEQTGAGVAPVELKELNGTTLIAGTDAWIKKFPAMKRSKEVDTVEFEIRVGEMKVFIGGMLNEGGAMLEPQTREIDGLSLTVTQLPAMRALKLLHKILKAVAPAGAKAASGGSLSLKTLSLNSLADAAELLF